MKIGSLFSGYGGLDLAVASVTGATVAWHAEIDKHASQILAARFPEVPNLGDISAVDWDAVEPVDIITGGFPCQDVSHAGLRAGVRHGTRSGLWFEMARAIDALSPEMVVIENVAGLLSAHADGDVEPCPWCLGDEPDGHLRALGAVLGDLAEMGFDARWGSVRASDAGAPHRRERVFIVATDANNGRCRQPDKRQWGIPVANTQRHEPVALLPTPAVNDMGAGKTVEQWDEWTDAMRGRHGNGNGHGKSLSIEAARLLPTPAAQAAKHGSTPDVTANGYGSNLWDLPTLLGTPTASSSAKGRSDGPAYDASSGKVHTPAELAHAIAEGKLLGTPTAAMSVRSHEFGKGRERNPAEFAAECATDFGPYAPAITRWANIIGRPAPSPTEPGKDGRPRLSPAFVEWMMGLPAGWVTDTGIPRNAQLKALGNGVVPQQAALALALLGVNP